MQIVTRPVDLSSCDFPEQLDPLLQRIYQARGISNQEQLDRQLSCLPKPASMQGIPAAVAGLVLALEQKHQIMIVGDFDAVGPAGPTTATRMDKFTRTMLEETGLMGMIGKAERGQMGIDAIRDSKAVYLIAVGGAAYLVSKAIVNAEVIAFPELGMEAIYEFEVKDMPVTVAVDTEGESVHRIGPEIWQAKIEEKALKLSE